MHFKIDFIIVGKMILTRIDVANTIEKAWDIFLQHREGCIEVFQHSDYRVLLLHSKLGTLQGTHSIERTTMKIEYKF